MFPFKGIYSLALLLMSLIVLSGCGAATDLAKDMDVRWGFINKTKFISPVKLRVGVTTFEDQVGLGTPLASSNTARLLEEELAKDGRVIVVPYTEVSAYMSQNGMTLPLTPDQAVQISQALNLNALVTGSISEVSQYNQRKNWRRALRFMTNSQEYVTAMLNVKVMDGATGIVLSSRANVGDYKTGPAEKDIFMENSTVDATVPGQESIEASMDLAISEASHRVIYGLSHLPFKAKAQNVTGGFAEINFGSQIGLKKGQQLYVLSVDHSITNAIGQSYEIYGAPRAELRVVEAGENHARLEIVDGTVSPGDLIQLKR